MDIYDESTGSTALIKHHLFLRLINVGAIEYCDHRSIRVGAEVDHCGVRNMDGVTGPVELKRLASEAIDDLGTPNKIERVAVCRIIRYIRANILEQVDVTT